MFVSNYTKMALTKKKVEDKPIHQKWVEYLESKGTKQSWLADQTGISPQHISNILAGRVLLTEENKAKINEALGTDFK